MCMQDTSQLSDSVELGVRLRSMDVLFRRFRLTLDENAYTSLLRALCILCGHIASTGPSSSLSSEAETAAVREAAQALALLGSLLQLSAFARQCFAALPRSLTQQIHLSSQYRVALNASLRSNKKKRAAAMASTMNSHNQVCTVSTRSSLSS